MHLYLHIPFCHRICPYCAFHKHTLAGHDVDAFVRALVVQSRLHSAEFQPGPVSTIHFGGGTPSLLRIGQLEAILSALRRHFDLSRLEELALEANPSTFDAARARAWAGLGVTRVSLGVQSFQPQLLRTLGRDHLPAEADAAFVQLREAGIPSVSLDLMFSLPGQSLDSWRADLDHALELGPDHLSAYNLTWEEDTDFLRRLQRGELHLAAESADADHFHHARQRLTGAGFEHYEVSNYARPGHRSLHNQAYWRGADYLALGPGAVATWRGRRWKNLPDTRRWTEALLAAGPVDPRVEVETLDPESLRLERLALGLRTRDGIDPVLLGAGARTTTLPLLLEAGLLTTGPNGSLRLSAEGMAVADEITLQLA